MNGEQDKNEGGSAAKLPPSLIDKVAMAIWECDQDALSTCDCAAIARAAIAVVNEHWAVELLKWCKAYEDCINATGVQPRARDTKSPS